LETGNKQTIVLLTKSVASLLVGTVVSYDTIKRIISAVENADYSFKVIWALEGTGQSKGDTSIECPECRKEVGAFHLGEHLKSEHRFGNI
jgi:hypothetical protein